VASNRNYLQHLAQVPLFSNCSTKDLQKIAKASDELKVPAGTVLVDQGQAGKEAFVLVEGSVTVSRNKRKVATLGPGSVIGELALLDRGPRTATVSCDTDCTILVIDQRNFAGVIDEVPALAHKQMAYLAAKIRELDRANFG
jgi:CRP/FNR family cyclic AMP-dependent transcriptional regulator